MQKLCNRKGRLFPDLCTRTITHLVSMKNLIEKVSEQLARVGRVRPINENSSHSLNPENLSVGMTHNGHQQTNG
ncbi:hypothetical protein D9O36_06970 [Zobellia amurskyensis]|uniref:Uncharacterized protein n=1 Tax=Zobellia amurskyensis TaxID=248905 RepID=A0A7X2ZSG7_9FLAO|nr:hypothetical protein [Zobellia amurskyensis]